MPVLPEYDSKANLDPGDTPRVQFDQSQFSAAAAQGAALQKLGNQGIELAQRFQLRQEQQEAYATKLNLDRWEQGIALEDQEALTKMPENGQGFADERLKNRLEKSEQFLQTVPANLREQYAQRLALVNDQAHVKYAGIEAKQTATFATTTLNQSLDGSKQALANNPEELEVRKADIAERIKLAPGIPESQKPDMIRAAQQDLMFVAAGKMAPTDPGQMAKMLGVTYAPSIKNTRLEERLVNRESGGKPGIVNQFGFAGLYQFGAPRLETLGVYTPGANEDLANWNTSSKTAPGKWSGTFNIPGHPEVKSLTDFLRSPDAQKAVFDAHTTEINSQIDARGLDKYIGTTVGGVPITRDGIVAMAHLGGIGGAAKALQSGGGSDARDANGSSLLSYARMGSGGSVQVASRATATDAAPEGAGDPRFAGLSYENKLKLIKQAEIGQAQAIQLQTQQATQAAAEAEKQRSAWVDQQQFAASKGQLVREQAEADFKAGKYKNFEEYHGVVSQIDKADKTNADLNGFNQALATPGYVWNPLDKSHRDMVEAGFGARGNDIGALQSVVKDTHIVPQSAVVAMRGAIVSNDPKRAEQAFTVASNLQRFNPNVFAGTQGAEDIQNSAVAFRHYVNDLGMSPSQATQQLLKEQTPEYQTAIKSKVKSLNVDEIVKKNVTEGDLKAAFNDGWPLVGRPEVGNDLGAKRAAMSDYEELFRERYVETGNVSTAKAQAVEQMKKVWGVSRVSGSPVLLRYPPEQAPAFAGVPDAADKIAAQAAATIKGATGADIPRKQIMVTPLPDGSTAPAYKSGEPPSFMLAWTDKNGVLHQSQKPFTPDPNAMRNELSQQRGAQFTQQRGQIDFSRSQQGRGFQSQARRAIDASGLGQEVMSGQ